MEPVVFGPGPVLDLGQVGPGPVGPGTWGGSQQVTHGYGNISALLLVWTCIWVSGLVFLMSGLVLCLFMDLCVFVVCVFLVSGRVLF